MCVCVCGAGGGGVCESLAQCSLTLLHDPASYRIHGATTGVWVSQLSDMTSGHSVSLSDLGHPYLCSSV